MDNSQITIAVDAMGGDNSPSKVLKGIELFLNKKPNTKIVIFGNKNKIEELLINKKYQIRDSKIIDSINNIEDDDIVKTILRHRKDSSISKGLEYIKEFKHSGFVSAGNTAALMILSKTQLGMIDGIDRPAICSIIPNDKNFSIMLDLGANSTVVAKNLLQFAIMGYCYHTILKPNVKPRIGIINIGTEDNKGLEFLKEASDLINESFLKDYFMGFIEPNKITSGMCDIMVSDGYTGNIMLKTAEGMSNFFTKNLKEMFGKSIKNKIAYSFLKNDLQIFKDQINPDKYNGAAFIGINGISIKSHGSANAIAFCSALERCYYFIENNINEKIRKNFENT